MKSSLQQWIRAGYGKRPASMIASLSAKYLRAYHNEDFWDMNLNGECRVLDLFLAHSGICAPRFFDIGAHGGAYTAMILSKCPSAEIHCFELIPNISLQLRLRYQSVKNVYIHEYGLSDKEGKAIAIFDEKNRTTSSLLPNLDHPIFDATRLTPTPAILKKGDDIVRQLGAGVDFMKLDVEGHEYEVLKGFKDLLSTSDSPRILQFEYGITYLPAHRTLKDIYTLLEPCGYIIGRIHPKSVDFSPYRVDDEHFRMGNYCAVKSTDKLAPLLRS